MTFGEKLRALMAERQISGRKLARLVPCDDGYLSRLAAGQRHPSPELAERLDGLLDAGGELAALRPAPARSDEHERLLLTARSPARLDGAVVDGLTATLASHRRLEDVVGSAAVRGAATAHLSLILRLLKDARGAHAGRLAATASEASQFVGWLNTAVGSHGKASSLYDQAMRLGLQAGNDDLVATALSMRGHLAWVTGEVAEMAALSKAAARQATATGTLTVATQQQGRAFAILGDREGALRAVGRAEEILDTGAGGDDPDGLYFLGAELLAMQRGLILAYLGEHAAAARLIGGAVASLPVELRDSEWVAWYRVQGAVARAAAGGVEEAVAELLHALGIVSATGGTKTRRDIVRAWRAMEREHPGHAGVAELAEALR